MFYRVRIDLAFTSLTNPEKARDAAKLLLNQAITINPGKPNEEKGYIMLEKCYHDEDPTKPCDLLGIWQPL